MAFFVILRGPLGAGKTTLALRLAPLLRGQAISVDRILEEHDLEQWDEDRISESSFLKANEIAIAQAGPLLRRGTPVVFDGNFYWRSAVDGLLGRLPYPHVVFTLKVPLEVCVARDAGRTVSLGIEAARDVYRMVTAFDYGVPVDGTGSIDETVARLVDGLGAAGIPGV